jgi:Ser/Thr protein kinase RdoA (MazF antagonist)
MELPPLPGDLPRRHCHGDLKISNILFADDAPARAHCLIDLDTLGRQTMAYELGDALRSWCNPSGEDTDRPAIDLGILESAMRGYARGAEGLLGAAEVAAIVPGLRTVCVELAARFCVDVFEDRYFGWDRTRFASRREHNLLRARGQLGLARSLVRDAERAEAIVRAALAG